MSSSETAAALADSREARLAVVLDAQLHRGGRASRDLSKVPSGIACAALAFQIFHAHDRPMRQNVNEFPKHPLPHVPAGPQEPQRPHVQPPTVFVYEREHWEYK